MQAQKRARLSGSPCGIPVRVLNIKNLIINMATMMLMLIITFYDEHAYDL